MTIYKAIKKDNGKCILCKFEKEISHRKPIDCLIMETGKEYLIKEHKFYTEYKIK